jgi:putative hydrolase of the HAD superfamily
MTASCNKQQAVIKAVVFDLGGVLIDLHGDKAKRELIETYGIAPLKFDLLTRSSFESPESSITELAMIGRVGIPAYLDAFLHECRIKDIEQLRVNRLSVVGRERSRVFQIAAKLKQNGFVCCVFTNTVALHWEKLCSPGEYPSLKLFDRVFASHLVGCAKPKEDAFRFIASALKIRMSECLLIDDTLLNVEMAQACGWHAILFRGPGRLLRKLRLMRLF